MVTTTDQGYRYGAALALVNTIERGRRGRRDHLADPGSSREWLDARGLLGPRAREAMGGPAFSREVFTELRALRGAARAIFHALSAREAPGAAALHALSRVVEAGSWTRCLVTAEGIVAVREIQRGETPLSLLAPIALAAARVMIDVDPKRLRECGAADCPTWFIDTSKGGRRRWCSMSTCGNRVKASRHRRRHADRS